MIRSLIRYTVVLKIPFSKIRGIHILFDPRLNGHGGMDHLTMKRGYPGGYRHTPRSGSAGF